MVTIDNKVCKQFHM